MDAYAADSLAAGRYDFHMGRKLEDHLKQAGFEITRLLSLKDREFVFDGPADPEVLDAWRNRFTRVRLLREFCGAEFEAVQEEFLGCLKQRNHRAVAKVYCVIADRKDTP